MSKLSNVECYYTGGGIYVYSAMFNNEVWLYGGLDWYFGSYDIKGEEIENNDMEYEKHWKSPSIPYPTWNEILQSLRDSLGSDPNLYEMERQLRDANPDMNERCIGEDDVHDYPPNPVVSNEKRLETIAQFIEIFEDFLDEKGIDIPNDEKDDDPNASTIYGTDYGILSDRIESLLTELNVLEREV